METGPADRKDMATYLGEQEREAQVQHGGSHDLLPRSVPNCHRRLCVRLGVRWSGDAYGARSERVAAAWSAEYRFEWIHPRIIDNARRATDGRHRCRIWGCKRHTNHRCPRQFQRANQRQCS